MKIGEFSKLFDLNSSTIRYYINNGLILPKKKNDQYEFGQQCVSDMEKILKYKSFYFSLEEIQLLFFLEKASRFRDEVVLNVCADMLENKRNELIEERENLTKCIDALEEEIKNQPNMAATDTIKTGIPFSFIPYLYCPVCGQPLTLDSATLSNGHLYKGLLSCECNYSAEIDDGVILCQGFSQDTPFKAFKNIESVATVKEQFSSAYRMLIERAYLWMYNQIGGHHDSPRCILAGPFTLNFILEYIENLGKNNTYIVFDPSLERIKKIRNYLSSENYNIVYIAGTPNQLPIKKQSVDIYIDDYSTTNSLFTYNTFNIEFIAPLLKRGGEVAGLFTTYQNAPNSLNNFKVDHPEFRAEKMTLDGLKYHWAEEKVAIAAKKSMGLTSSNAQDFLQNVKDESIEVFGYYAIKK